MRNFSYVYLRRWLRPLPLHRATLLLLLALVALPAPARLAAQDEPPTAAELSDSSIPPLRGGESAPPPVFAPPAFDPAPDAPAAAPVITVWYGPAQRAGHQGDPQKWLNVLGNVTSAAPLESVTYSLNGGPALPLALGPDDMRLARPGDFNVELDYTDLRPGANAVTISALDEAGEQSEIDITITYQSHAPWTPGTYFYDWATAARIDDLGQIVDGHWVLDGGGVRPTVFDFDRLLALGDLSWRDYTVTVPITVYAIDEAGYKAPSNGPGVGVMVRWQGHYDAGNGVTPLTGWRRLGALGWYRWRRNATTSVEGFQLLGHGGRDLGEGAGKLNLGVTYMFKLSVASDPNPAIPAGYRFKVWPATQAEPAAWDVEKRGITGEPTGGGLLLVAHHVDARFGEVRVDLAAVRPAPALSVTIDGAGQVTTSPAAPFRFGQDVALTAVPALSSVFAGWGGALEGTANPATLTLFENTSVDAAFTPGGGGAVLPLIMSAAGSGRVGGVGYSAADVLGYDDGRWAMRYNAAAAGTIKNVTALAADGDDLLLVFAATQRTPGGSFTPWDVARFTPSPGVSGGTFTPVLRGATAGLSALGEKIDALDLLADGRLLISTTGAASVPRAGGGVLRAQDDDILSYDPAGGVWSAVFDGAAVPGLAAEDINGLWRNEATGDLYLTLLGSFQIGRPAVSGNGRTVLRLRPDANAPGGYRPAVYWTAANLGASIDAIELLPET